MPNQYAERNARIRQALAQGLLRPVDRRREAEKAQRNAALGQVGGQVAGVAGSLGGMWAANQLGLGASSTGGALASGLAGSAAPSAPTILGAGVAGSAPTTAATGAATTGTLGGLAGALAPAAAVAAAVYRGNQLYNMNDKISQGGGISGGFKEGMKPENWIAGGLVGSPLIGAAMGAFGGKKHSHQRARDNWRESLQGQGMIDDDYNMSLADGSKYNVGYDGGHMLQNEGTENYLNDDPNIQNRISQGERFAYEVDPTKQGSAQDIGYIDPLSEIAAAKLSGGDAGTQERLRAQGTGYGVNAIQSSGDTKTNALGMYEQAGLGRDDAYTEVLKLFDGGGIDEGRRDAYLASIDNLFGIG